VPTLPLYAQSKTSSLGWWAGPGPIRAVAGRPALPLGLTADWIGAQALHPVRVCAAALGAWIMRSAGELRVAVGRAVTGLGLELGGAGGAYSGLFDPAESTRRPPA